MIKCLSEEVQAKLRSGVAVPSLQQCVEELVLNSIDAAATCVGVRMDLDAFKVQVVDNGAGMSAEDMECVGSRYHTSKCSSVDDLDNLRFYGFRGEAVASIVSLATLVEISSRARSSVKTLVRVFKEGTGLDVFESEAGRPSAGTTVVICNFFHNMPVRRKRMDAVLEGERIRHRVEAVSLMHPSVSFTLKNDSTGAMMVQLPKARDTLHRFTQIHGRGRAQKLGEVRHSHAQFEVSGYIGREGHYNNGLQYLYANDRLLLRTRIHKLLNLLLRRLSGTNQTNDSPDGPPATRSPRQKRSQELHGVYIINIKCPYSEYDICLEPAKTLIEFKDWDVVLLCIEEAVKAFLCRENLMAAPPQNDSDGAPTAIFGTESAHQDGAGGVPVGTPALDRSGGVALASESVHRKWRDRAVPEGGGACREARQTEGHEGSEEQGELERTTADEQGKRIQNECRASAEGRDEPQRDGARLEPPADDNMAEEEEPAISDAEEGNEKATRITDMASSCSMHSLDGINQEIQLRPHIHTDCQGAGGCGQSNRKISLSDPYVHESLQTRRLPQISRSPFNLQGLAVKCEEGTSASKRKISLGAGLARSRQTEHTDTAPVVPSKIPKITSAKLSFCRESGSLDRFRRIHGTSDELKAPPAEAQCRHNARRPQADGCILNPQNRPVSQKEEEEQQQCDGTETRGSSSSSSCSSSAFTKLKNASAQIRAQTSLAAKLNHLKQHVADGFRASEHLSCSTSQGDGCPGARDSVQDGNNNAVTGPDDGAHPQRAEREETTASGDWLHHYDASAGRTVYVNKVTGLSRYEEPPTEDLQVCCTSDVTNMAVSVISETGMEYRCYPFQAELVLPFLPKSRAERVFSSGDGDESSNSLTSLYSKWNNPVFVHPPTVGVDMTSGQAGGLAVKIHNILFPYRFSKAMIHSMKVINQVDRKFLACLINSRDEDSAAETGAEGNLLVLLDQHAAHERVRLESLVADSYEDDAHAAGERRLCSSAISPPLEIRVTDEELRLLRSCQAHLCSLGLEVKFSQTTDPQVLVGKVPMCFMEREINERRRGRPSVIKLLVEKYLREQIELLRSAGRVRGTLPLTVLRVLASLACHGAIKFNHSLSRDECCGLVASLSSCQLPFQCAHGRPSIAPLVDVLHLDADQKEEVQRPNLRKLRRMYKAWELYGNR